MPPNFMVSQLKFASRASSIQTTNFTYFLGLVILVNDSYKWMCGTHWTINWMAKVELRRGKALSKGNNHVLLWFGELSIWPPIL